MKSKFYVWLILLPLLTKSQTFELGDVALNFNYGAPQITPLIMKTTLNIFYKNKWLDDTYNISVNGSGVLNAKAEYCIYENLGLGLAASYWNMDVNIAHAYRAQDPYTLIDTDFTDRYIFGLSALALGVRGNYHMLGGEKRKVVDPYVGLTLGVTRYTYRIDFKSDFPGRSIPSDVFQFRSGWGSYISSTVGIRVYPVKFIGLNFEAGFDRGAFLFAGIVFKIHTQAPEFLRD
jgi:hypothetical protein